MISQHIHEVLLGYAVAMTTIVIALLLFIIYLYRKVTRLRIRIERKDAVANMLLETVKTLSAIMKTKAEIQKEIENTVNQTQS